MRYINRFIFRIKTISKFIKLGWEDYWFDYYYLEKLIIWKLNQMSVNFKENGDTENSGKAAAEMKEIADRFYFLTEELEDSVHDEHANKFPNRPRRVKVFEPIENGYKRMVDSPEMVKYRQTKEGKKEKLESKKLFQIIADRQVKERRKIYSDIAKKIPEWWD